MSRKINVHGCADCGNKEWFVAEFTQHAECIVNQHGEEVEGIDSKSSNPFCDGDFTTEITNVYKCAACGSKNIEVEIKI